MKGVLQKSRKLMRDKHNIAGVLQVDKALRTLVQPGRQAIQNVSEDEELALRQMISGIIPEWKEASEKGKRDTIKIMKLWTGDMMNWARVHMKNWTNKKNDNKAKVQRRWDNRGIMKEAFQKGKLLIRPEQMVKGVEHKEGKMNNEKTYGIKHWGRVRAIPRLHKQIKRFLQSGVG
eukprot:5708927-Pleurochrysis_carterae.AAC.1